MKEKLKRIRGSGNVFLDLGFDKAEAENLKMRSQLMMRIEDFCRQSDMTQAAAAKVLGITQKRKNSAAAKKISGSGPQSRAKKIRAPTPSGAGSG